MSRFIPLHEQIFLNRGNSPDFPAISFGEEVLTYSELLRVSTQLAHQLRMSGAGPGSTVGIYLDPSVSLAVSVLAVLKTGAAYIPLSKSFPENRINYILQDARATLVVADKILGGNAVPANCRLFVPDLADLAGHEMESIPDFPAIQPSDLAYILYTSGSTGNPKGVMIEHRNLYYYVNWFCQKVIPSTGVSLPLTSSFIFAAAVTQFYSTLLSGKTLHIIDPLMIRQPDRLMKWYGDHPGTGLYCVPTLWSEILHFLGSSVGQPNQRMAPSCVYLSGEAVTDELIKRSFRILPELQLWNLYGPTEATANITASRLWPGEPAHIGKPLEGTRIFIVDENLRTVQQGHTGELLACGDGIARGYLNLPGLTASTFVTAMPDGVQSLPVYRSGDLVREDEHGNLKYMGRLDQQVKIRGFRIELTEIEQALMGISGITHAAARVTDENHSAKRLVAYLVYSEAPAIPVDELRRMLGKILPDFMIPEVYVTLHAMPQLQNGKIDRKSLPLPGQQRPHLGYPAVMPGTPDEKMMVRIWEEVLGLEGIGLDDNFFDIGGNSLKANEIILELQVKMGRSFGVKHVFENPTPSGLLRSTSSSAGFSGESDQNPLMQLPQQTAISENQKAMWFMNKAEPGLAAYNIFYSIIISGELDADCLEYGLGCILARHTSLSTRFPAGNHPTTGHPASQPEIVLETFGFSAMRMQDANDHARSMAFLPFNLEQGPPCRFILYQIDDGSHLLAFIVHHIVFDGFSFELFLRDLSKFCVNGNARTALAHLSPDDSFTGFCHDEAVYLRGNQYLSDRVYWQQQLSLTPAFFELPTDFPRRQNQARDGEQLRRTMPAMLRTQLKRMGEKQGATMFMTCLAAFTVLLYRQSGRLDFLVGTPVVNRGKKDFLQTIGYFVNTMLFRATVDPAARFTDWLTTVRDRMLENLLHSRFPLSHLGEVVKTQRIPGVNPFFQVMFAFHETAWEFTDASGLTWKAMEEFSGRSKFDLFAEIFEGKQETEIVFTFSTGLYHTESMRILMDHFLQLMESICGDPETSLEKLNLLSQEEYHRIVHHQNQTSVSGDLNGTVTDQVFRQVLLTPDLPALVTREVTISYRAMGMKIDTITSNLLRLGVEKGTPVGIHLENSPAMIMCILAIFRAGGVYVPLDPYYPVERLRYVIEKTRTRFLVVDKERQTTHQLLSEYVIPVEDLLAEGNPQPHTVSEGVPAAAELAYIMFTSGSTGNPKGVMIRHNTLLNFVSWIKKELNVSARDSCLLSTSINFDISLLEMFLPLMSGARLVLEKRSELQAPEKVEAVMNEMKINILQFVPSGLKALSDAGVFKRAKYLKTLLSGGEKLSKNLEDQVFGDFSGNLVNLYGPTEATIYMACWHCQRDNLLRTVPIGFPINNARFYLLDEHQEPVPAGIPGEIYIGGQVLAEGYFEEPAQTGSKFVPDPFSEHDGDKMYRTGDLGRYLYNGAVEFLGRTDHQVKVRGFRIELGEVESVIHRFPGVSRVVVDAQEQKEEDVRLTAYLVPEPGTTIPESDLRDFLKLYLPAYMIPGNFIIAPAIPMLPNGKTDFKALMNLVPRLPKLPEFLHKSMNETEFILSGIWKDILGHEAFTLQDNFFEVGGHSLLLVTMQEMIAAKLNAEISIVDLFHYPAIRSLANFLRKDMPEHSHADIAKRVSMRNKNIRQMINKRIFPDNNQH